MNLMNMILIHVILVWFLGLGCADHVTEARVQPKDVVVYPTYVGEVIVENRSQFPYTALYFHQERMLNLASLENLFIEPLNPGDRLQVMVDEAQYVTAIRPRVAGGPLWRVQSARPVVFYATENTPTPSLWIVDQGFIVIDALSR